MATNLSIFQRKQQLAQLAATHQWDILVVGGGATGLGIALDATLRGYKTLLVEQGDFANATSSRSTKLIHGGVRYLAQGNIKLVREACIERSLLCANAPHLVKPQSFLVPVYSWFGLMKYFVGLKLYDALAGKHSLGTSVFISKNKALQQMPGIQSKGLLGAIRYWDAQFDDARLAINLMQAILYNGGTAINYMQLTHLQKNENGIICGAHLTDRLLGYNHSIKAHAVVNATGVFADTVLKMDNAHQAQTISASQGVHLVLDKNWLPSAHALMIPSTSDGRVLFAIPWHQKLIVGTTDTPVKEILQHPVAMQNEIDFILETAGKYFARKPTHADVLSVWAGLRPLAMPRGGAGKTREISRSHKMIQSSGKLFTIVGGKWTTFRKMATDMMQFIETAMGWPARQSLTDKFMLNSIFPLTVSHSPIQDSQMDDKVSSKQKWISASLQIDTAQIIDAVKFEMAIQLDDVLCRRTRALFLDAVECRRIAPEVARIMANELGHSSDWVNKQVEDFMQMSCSYLAASSQPNFPG